MRAGARAAAGAGAGVGAGANVGARAALELGGEEEEEDEPTCCLAYALSIGTDSVVFGGRPLNLAFLLFAGTVRLKCSTFTYFGFRDGLIPSNRGGISSYFTPATPSNDSSAMSGLPTSETTGAGEILCPSGCACTWGGL